MKNKKVLLAGVIGLLLVALAVFCVVYFGRDTECTHQWGDWTATVGATCTSEGSQERQCSLCGEKETSAVAALSHDWSEATCSTPKKCKNCSATEGEALAHSYTVETVS